MGTNLKNPIWFYLACCEACCVAECKKWLNLPHSPLLSLKETHCVVATPGRTEKGGKPSGLTYNKLSSQNSAWGYNEEVK
jgi:hypothetical protein